MRAVPFAVLSAVILLPACDDKPQLVPLPLAWMEWADTVTAGTQFGVRLYGVSGAEPRELRIRIGVAGDTVTIEPFTVVSTRDMAFVYDTLVWVPGIAAASPRTIVLRAPSNWQQLQTPFPLRVFGSVTVTPDTPVVPLMRSVGVGSGFEGSLGCYMVAPSPLKLYISADQPPDWAPGFTGFVYGRVDPVLRSTCLDDAPVIYVDSIR